MKDNIPTVQDGEDKGIQESKCVRDELNTILSDKSLRKAGMPVFLEALKAAPALGGIISVGEKILMGLRQLEEDTRRERLIGYLTGLIHIRREDLDIRRDDLLAVIRKLQEDDEWDKLEYYVHLTVNLAESDLPEAMRYHFISMVSGMTCFQIEFTRQLYIRRTIPLKGYLSSEDAMEELLDKDDGITRRAVRTLIDWGLIREDSEERTWAKRGYDLTTDLTTLMTLLFHSADLQPDVLNLVAKDTADVILIRSNNVYKDLFNSYLPSVLSKAGLTVEVVRDTDNHQHNTYAPRYLMTRGMQNGSTGKNYINVHVLRNTDPQFTPKPPDRDFMIEEEVFRGSAWNKNDTEQQLRQCLDEVARYVVQLHQTTP